MYMKLKKIGKIAVVIAASTALVTTLINDKKNKESTSNEQQYIYYKIRNRGSNMNIGKGKKNANENVCSEFEGLYGAIIFIEIKNKKVSLRGNLKSIFDI